MSEEELPTISNMKLRSGTALMELTPRQQQHLHQQAQQAPKKEQPEKQQQEQEQQEQKQQQEQEQEQEHTKMSLTPLSQEAKKLELERKEVEIGQMKDTWLSSCCGETKSCSRSLIKYAVQCTFSFMVLVFAMYMLVITQEGGYREVWISTMSTIVGLHVPNPSMDREAD